LPEILATSSFSPSAQKQEAGGISAFFLRGKKKAWQRKSFFKGVSEQLQFMFFKF